MADSEFILERDGTRLRLHTPRDPHGDGYIMQYECDLTEAGLHAVVTVTDQRPSGFIQFFAGMETQWRGWEGVISADSLEHNLSIEATRDGIGHVILKIIVRSNPYEGFRVETSMVLDAGDLERLAKSAKNFLTL